MLSKFNKDRLVKEKDSKPKTADHRIKVDIQRFHSENIDNAWL